jgi:aspartate-semialdehyde dehydrogenase
MSKYAFNVGILGATGAVGQKFIRLLQNHPWFTITALAASERSAGKKYAEAANWVEDVPLSDYIANLTVKTSSPETVNNVDFVFSGLDSSVAGEIEQAFAQAGIPVISNAKNHRMLDYVPLLVPEVNPDHLRQIEFQESYQKNGGFIITNPNCVTVPLTLALKPIQDAFGIESLVVTSLQAVSGAGYPGVPCLDILGNVIPFIDGEEPKVETEGLKILGSYQENGTVLNASIPMQATATRVPTIDGHLLSMMFNTTKKASLEELISAIEQFKNPIAELNLPSSPEKTVVYYHDDRFPQPRKQAMQYGGMACHVGRARTGTVLHFSLVAMAHNTIRGAAGGAILNAELLVEKGYIKNDNSSI